MSATPDGALPAEDAKLVTLARAARARVGGAEGAALRDDIGRTYAAGSVDLPSLRLTALQAAVAAAVSSGSDQLAAACVRRGGRRGSRTPTGGCSTTSASARCCSQRPDGTLRPA